ncbi:unnamed protein product [Malus baccata var. baccata]
MDVSVMKFSCCAENIASIPVSVSMVEPVEQLDPISSPHDKQIFTYEGLKPSDDRADLRKFATPHGKTYLSHAWRNYISHVGQEFPGGVKEFRQRLMKYAVEKGFRYVYVRNDSERVIAECFNKDDEGCVWRVHAILNRPSRLFYIKSMNNVHTCKARFRDKKSIKMGSKIVASVLVDEIRTNPILMEMSSDRQREAERWTSPICPTMDDEMMKMVEVGRHWNVCRSSEHIFEVRDEYSVMWQIKAFPCAHALAAILKDGGNPYDYVEDYFTIDFYKSSYSYPIIPVPDIEKDEQSMSQEFVIEPPLTKRPPGVVMLHATTGKLATPLFDIHLHCHLDFFFQIYEHMLLFFFFFFFINVIK